MGAGEGAAGPLPCGFSRLSGRLLTTRQAGRAGAASGPEGPSSGDGGPGAAGGGGSLGWSDTIEDLMVNRSERIMTYLGSPFRCVFSSRSVFRFDTHEFSDFTREVISYVGTMMTTKERDQTYYWSARRSSRSFPTSASRIRTSPARALLKSFRYL
jgi:hypothetical protein